MATHYVYKQESSQSMGRAWVLTLDHNWYALADVSNQLRHQEGINYGNYWRIMWLHRFVCRHISRLQPTKSRFTKNLDPWHGYRPTWQNHSCNQTTSLPTELAKNAEKGKDHCVAAAYGKVGQYLRSARPTAEMGGRGRETGERTECRVSALWELPFMTSTL